jgi:hypothetical protein
MTRRKRTVKRKTPKHNQPSTTVDLGVIRVTKFFHVDAFEHLKNWMTPVEWRHLYAFDLWKWSFVIIRRNR